jgi:hypothetical protein
MRRSTKPCAIRALAAAVGVAAVLAGCSDLYYDRRETILFGADNAVAANIAAQTIDPWPRASVDRHIPGNGERVEAAIIRYRAGRVLTPLGNGTSNTYQQQQPVQQQQQQVQGAGVGSGPAGIPAK